MSKLLKTAASRLICFGGAKTCTNAVWTTNLDEDGIFLGFDD